jgi:hypothetical protein
MTSFFVSQVMLVLMLGLQPFNHIEDDLIATGAQLALVLCFAGGAWHKAYLEFETEGERCGNPGVATRVMGFTSVDSLENLILASLVLMLVLVGSICIGFVIADAAQPAVRLRKTGKKPALQMGPSEQWHLFLSHVRRPFSNPALSNTVFIVCASS